MPSLKMKTHKGSKKRFTVTAHGKVKHKRCGSSHLNSHKSGKKIRRLRKKSIVKVAAEAKRLRRGMQKRESINPTKVAVAVAQAQAADEAMQPAPEPGAAATAE